MLVDFSVVGFCISRDWPKQRRRRVMFHQSSPVWPVRRRARYRLMCPALAHRPSPVLFRWRCLGRCRWPSPVLILWSLLRHRQVTIVASMRGGRPRRLMDITAHSTVLEITRLSHRFHHHHVDIAAHKRLGIRLVPMRSTKRND